MLGEVGGGTLLEAEEPDVGRLGPLEDDLVDRVVPDIGKDDKLADRKSCGCEWAESFGDRGGEGVEDPGFFGAEGVGRELGLVGEKVGLDGRLGELLGGGGDLDEEGEAVLIQDEELWAVRVAVIESEPDREVVVEFLEDPEEVGRLL
jgi:hypothetical protein